MKIWIKEYQGVEYQGVGQLDYVNSFQKADSKGNRQSD